VEESIVEEGVVEEGAEAVAEAPKEEAAGRLLLDGSESLVEESAQTAAEEDKEEAPGRLVLDGSEGLVDEGAKALTGAATGGPLTGPPHTWATTAQGSHS